MRGPHHGHQDDGEHEPMGLIQYAPHSLVGREQTPHHARPLQCRYGRDRERQGKKPEQERTWRPVPRVGHGEHDPGDEYDLDDAAEQQRLADEKGKDRRREKDQLIVDDKRKKRGLPTDDKRGEQDQSDPDPDHAKGGTFDWAKRHGKDGLGDTHTLTPLGTDGL